MQATAVRIEQSLEQLLGTHFWLNLLRLLWAGGIAVSGVWEKLTIKFRPHRSQLARKHDTPSQTVLT